MKTLTKLILPIVTLATAIAPLTTIASCSNDDSGEATIKSVSINGPTHLFTNQSQKYEAVVTGTRAFSTEVTWFLEEGSTGAIFNRQTSTLTTFSTAGTVKLTAISVADNTKKTTIEINIEQQEEIKYQCVYHDDDNTATIASVRTSLTKIFIPEMVIRESDQKRFIVVRIAEQAFEQNENIEEVILPDSIKEIKQRAFDECHNLSKVTLPQNLLTIEDSAFRHTNLVNVEIPASVISIGTSAFGNCNELQTLKVASGNRVYLSTDENFQECNCIVRISDLCLISAINTTKKIPSFVKIIAESAFDCLKTPLLTVIPEGVEHIASSAFLGSSFQSIDIPSSLKSAGDHAFSCGVEKNFKIYFRCIFDEWPANFSRKMFDWTSLTGTFYSSSDKINELVKSNFRPEEIKGWKFEILPKH